MWPWEPERVLNALGAKALDEGAFHKIAQGDSTGSGVKIAQGDSKGSGVQGVCTDSRKITPGCLFVAIRGEVHDGHDHLLSALEQGAAFCLGQSDWAGWGSVPEQHRSRCFVSGDVLSSFRKLAALFRETFSFPVIGVGGSNGKTTTKELLKAMLSGKGLTYATEKSENGYLGTAMTLTKAHFVKETSPSALVLEIGIDETGAMAQHVVMAKPNLVLLTALGPEHLAGLGTWENAIEEELKLFQISPGAERVWQGDEPALKSRAPKEFGTQDTWVAQTDPTNSSTTHLEKLGFACRKLLVWKLLEERKEGSLISVEFLRANCPSSGSWQFSVPLPGLHNAQNFALALGTALHLGVSFEQIQTGLLSFVPPALRSRVHALPNQVYLYNDCYNSSPSSLQAAIDVLKSGEWKSLKKCFVLGDMLDLGDESKAWHDKIPAQLEGILGLSLCLIGNAMYDVYMTLKTSPNWSSDWNAVSSSASARVCWFASAQDVDLARILSEDILQNMVVLVKASRGVGLDLLVDPLLRRMGSD